MKHLLVVILAALTISACTACATVGQLQRVPTNPVLERVMQSVWPMRSTMDSQGFCTAFSISRAKGLWMTAGHCVLGQEAGSILPAYVWLKQTPVTIVYVDADNDVAVFRSESQVVAIPMSDVAPKVGDEADMVAWTVIPDYNTPMVSYGRVAAVDAPIPSDGRIKRSMMVIAGGIPGQSGSPVVNSLGQLIGVHWGGRSDAPYSVDVPFDAVWRAYHTAVDRP